MIFSQVKGGSVAELLGPFSLTHDQFKQCADANKFPDDMTYRMDQVGAADGSGSALPGADWRQMKAFAAATCAATRFNQAHPFDRDAALGSDESANAWPALSWWVGRETYSDNHEGILGPLVGKDIFTINGQSLKVGDQVLKVLYETNTEVVLGVSEIADDKKRKKAGSYDHVIVMSQTNVEKCKKDLPANVMTHAVITGDFDSIGVKFSSRPSKGLGRNAQVSFNLPDCQPISLPFRVVLGTNAIEPPGKETVGSFFTAPSDVSLDEGVSGPSESSEVVEPLGSHDRSETTVTYAKSDGPTNTVASYLICSRTGGLFGVFSNAEILMKLASTQSTHQLDEDSPFSALGSRSPDGVNVKLAPGTKASLVPTKHIHQKQLFEKLEGHERAATKNPGVLPLHDSSNLDGVVLQAAVEGVVIGELIGLLEAFRARESPRDEEGDDPSPTIKALDGLIGRLVEASCREGMANEPARCSSAVDVAVVIIAQLMEQAETRAEEPQRVESSQQTRRGARLDLTKFEYELATMKVRGNQSRPYVYAFESTDKWTLKTIRKSRDGARLIFTKAGRDSPLIDVTDLSDVAQSAAQLDRRVRFKAGKPAGATLVTIIKAHLANRT